MMFKIFILAVAFIQGVTGFAELLFPGRSYRLWRGWVDNRFFFLHGIVLIAVGFPLTFYKGYLSGLLFYVGLFIVFAGPFVLIYPEKIRKSFEDAESELSPGGIIKIVYLDSAFRLAFGLLLLVSYCKTWGAAS